MVMMGDDGVPNCVCYWPGRTGGREVFVLTSIRHSILVPMCNQRRGSKMQCARMLLPSALFIKSDFLFA